MSQLVSQKLYTRNLARYNKELIKADLKKKVILEISRIINNMTSKIEMLRKKTKNTSQKKSINQLYLDLGFTKTEQKKMIKK
jgi:hypothetical protein